MNDHTTQYPLDPNKEYAPWVYEYGLSAPYGKCQCTCGQKTKIAKQTLTERGQSRGQPVRFIRGHWGKLQTKQSVEERFWSKVDVRGPNECWEWTAYLSKKGYGSLIIDGVITNAQRISWQIHFGPIPDGIHVLHQCDRPSCQNPAHLFLGTHQDNMRDRNSKNRQARQPGTSNPSAKVTDCDVREIRKLRAQGVKLKTIAKRYGIAVTNVSMIARRATWKHVE